MSEALPNYDSLLELEKINVIVVGGGGRERALLWRLAQSNRIGNLSLVSSSSDPIEFAQDPDNDVSLAVIGSDDDLARGIVDDFTRMGIPAFGPTQQAARIESSKPYAKRTMLQSGVPTAAFGVYDNAELAHQRIDSDGVPVYVKAGGLALGKGAVECLTAEVAHKAIDDMMVKKVFGSAGDEVVIEELLRGQEISLHAICDGETYLMFDSSQDNKRRDAGDQGPNTGGMGTISPVPWFSQEDVKSAGLLAVQPILEAMHREGNDFSGLLYPGVMVDENGGIKVLEFNARFGDPETQVYMRRLKSDLLELFVGAVTHNLGGVELEWSDEFAACIIAASGGYPGSIEMGKRIYGIDEANSMNGIEVFLAGVAEQDGEYYTSGGRVLGVTAVGATLSAALDSGYAAMERIQFEGKKVRPDIGEKSLKKT